MASIYKKITYHVDKATGEQKKSKSTKWWIKYRDGLGIVRRTPGFRDKAATQQRAAELEREAELEQVNAGDPFREHRKRSLVQHVDDFENHLRGNNVSDDQRKLVISRLLKILDGCRFVFMADISASKVQGYLADQRNRKVKPISVQTSNHYLRAIKQFTRWLVRDRRAAEDPIAYLSMLNVRTDRRHDRRALSLEELGRLIQAAENGPVIEKTSGPERAMIYILAAWTGLRRNEIGSLTLRSFDFEARTVTVRAAYSKRRREDVIPLHRDLVEALRTHLAGRSTDSVEPVFPIEDRRTCDMIRRDLEAAGIDRVDEDGLFVDFHSLRHTFVSNLSKSGVGPKQAQDLARHSDINLTMRAYTHLTLDDQASAIDSLPRPPSPPRQTGGATDIPMSRGAQIGALGAQNGALRVSLQDSQPVVTGAERSESDLGEEPETLRQEEMQGPDSSCPSKALTGNGHGDGWESNPPDPRLAGPTGFEDRGGHQIRLRPPTKRG